MLKFMRMHIITFNITIFIKKTKEVIFHIHLDYKLKNIIEINNSLQNVNNLTNRMAHMKYISKKLLTVKRLNRKSNVV